VGGLLMVLQQIINRLSSAFSRLILYRLLDISAAFDISCLP